MEPHFLKANFVICIPSGGNEVERRADARRRRHGPGGRRVSIIEEPLAAASERGFPSPTPPEHGRFISAAHERGRSHLLGGIVAARSVRVGGDEFDAAIIQYVMRKPTCLSANAPPEAIKIEIGSAFPFEDDARWKSGPTSSTDCQDPADYPQEIREALADSLASVIVACAQRSSAPARAFRRHHRPRYYLTGGGALLLRLDRLIAQETGIVCTLAEARSTWAEGAGRVLENISKLSGVSPRGKTADKPAFA